MIPFTQFLQPDGRRRAMVIERPPEVEAQAEALLALGYRFEVEILTTGEVSMECLNDDGALAGAIAPNGPVMLEALDGMIAKAHALVTA